MKKYVFLIAVIAIGIFALSRMGFSPSQSLLKMDGWHPQTRESLEALIHKGAHKSLPVVFDFDNTVICRDITEAMLLELIDEGHLQVDKVPAYLSPVFKNDAGEKISLEGLGDVASFYEAYADGTQQREIDPSHPVESYAWLVEIFQSLSPWQLVKATQAAYENGAGESDVKTGGETFRRSEKSKVAYHKPFFYPQMVELIAVLIQQGYEVWVISASNSWSVRYMVTKVLNPKLKALGAQEGILPQRVIGLSTLLLGDDEKLYKDQLLVQTDEAYANLEKNELKRYTLTPHVVYPLGSFEGKTATIFKWIKRQPYLVAGDSQNDFSMLSYGQNQLWIARLEKPKIQAKMRDLLNTHEALRKTWLIQPVLHHRSPGFVSSLVMLKKRVGEKAAREIKWPFGS